MDRELKRKMCIGMTLVKAIGNESQGVVRDNEEDPTNDYKRVMFAVRERGKQRFSVIAHLCEKGGDFYELAASIGRSVYEMAISAAYISADWKERLPQFLAHGRLALYDSYRKYVNASREGECTNALKSLEWYSKAQEEFGKTSTDIKAAKKKYPWDTRRIAEKLDQYAAQCGNDDRTYGALHCSFYQVTSASSHGGAQLLTWASGLAIEPGVGQGFRVQSSEWKSLQESVLGSVVLLFTMLTLHTSRALNSKVAKDAEKAICDL